MDALSLQLPKTARLCGHTAIEQLFRQGQWHRAHLLHTVYQIHKGIQPHQALFTVARRQVRKAVWRNQIKRHMRESFRLCQHLLPAASTTCQFVRLGFIYKGPAPIVLPGELRHVMMQTIQYLSHILKKVARE